MKLALFVLFALGAVTGVAAVMSVPMQALAGGDVPPVSE
jgi:hypothetical protein